MKKLLVIGVGFFLAASLFASGGVEDKGAPMAVETVSMRYVVPGAPRGSDPDGLSEVIARVNELMAAENLGIELLVKYIPWDAWVDKTNVMLASGEAFELLHIMENWMPSQIFAARGALVPLDDLIKQYAPDLYGKFQEYMWTALEYNGRPCSIPAYWRDATNLGGEVGDVSARKDLLEKYGLSFPKTAAELLDTAEKLQKLHTEWNGDAYIWQHEINCTPVWLHRTYDSWPFHVQFSEELIYVDMKGNVKAWIETEEFKKDCEFFREAYTRGLIHPDVLTIPRDLFRNQLNNEQYLFGLGTKEIDSYPNLNYPEAEGMTSFLEPEKSVMVFLPVLNSNAIPATTDTPEAGIKFLNWLYEKQDNMALFTYGIEGKHWNRTSKNRMEFVRNENNRELYSFDWWQIGYAPYRLFNRESEETIRLLTEPNTNVVMSPTVGFVFDTEPVSTEYTNLLAAVKNYVYPLKFGVVEFDEYYPEALSQLKVAGIDKVIAEYKKQFDAWKKSK